MCKRCSGGSHASGDRPGLSTMAFKCAHGGDDGTAGGSGRSVEHIQAACGDMGFGDDFGIGFSSRKSRKVSDEKRWKKKSERQQGERGLYLGTWQKG
jgi:hypothetical protein